MESDEDDFCATWPEPGVLYEPCMGNSEVECNIPEMAHYRARTRLASYARIDWTLQPKNQHYLR